MCEDENIFFFLTCIALSAYISYDEENIDFFAFWNYFNNFHINKLWGWINHHKVVLYNSLKIGDNKCGENINKIGKIGTFTSHFSLFAVYWLLQPY